MSLGYYEVVKDDSEEHAVVEKVLKTTSLAEGDKDTIKLITKTDDWCVNFIRHKKRETYCHGDKYQVTLTEVSEFQLERERQQSTPVHIYPDNYRKSHFECEVSFSTVLQLPMSNPVIKMYIGPPLLMGTCFWPFGSPNCGA